jgi:hypothetical protein
VLRTGRGIRAGEQRRRGILVLRVFHRAGKPINGFLKRYNIRQRRRSARRLDAAVGRASRTIAKNDPVRSRARNAQVPA